MTGDAASVCLGASCPVERSNGDGTFVCMHGRVPNSAERQAVRNDAGLGTAELAKAHGLNGSSGAVALTTLHQGVRQLPQAPPRTLAEVDSVFRHWLYLEDLGMVYVVLATVAANLCQGDPLWVQLVGASSGGKTEVLNSLSLLPNVHAASTMTEGSLLSGTPKKETAQGARGGLLRAIGEFGVIICKDFGSILVMNRDQRSALLAALREIYDGSWTRHIGVDGGRELHWDGKVALIGGCTAAIDDFHAVSSVLGERYLLYRIPKVDAAKQGRRALANVGHEAALRAELAEAVAGLFAGLGARETLPELEEGEADQIVALASLVAHARSGVVRDGRTREIELIPDTEGPARLAQELQRLLGGLRIIGVDQKTAWRLTVKVGLDCIPKLRCSAFDVLVAASDWCTTSTVAVATSYPTSTTTRALQDLAIHGVVERQKAPRAGQADGWRLNSWAREQYLLATTSDMSDEGGTAEGSYKNPSPAYDDFSEELHGDSQHFRPGSAYCSDCGCETNTDDTEELGAVCARCGKERGTGS
jgi:hypothetical protein